MAWTFYNTSGGIITGGVSSIAGTANEITASAATGDVTLSLPTAITLTGKTVTGGTFASPTLSGTVAGTYTLGGTPTLGAALIAGSTHDLGTASARLGVGFFNTLSMGASPASTGTIRLPSTGTINFRNAADTVNIEAIRLNGDNILTFAAEVGNTIANDAILTITGAVYAQKVIILIGNSTDDNCAFILVSGGVAAEVSDPGNKYSITVDTASMINVYVSAGALTVQNKAGASRTVNILAFSV